MDEPRIGIIGLGTVAIYHMNALNSMNREFCGYDIDQSKQSVIEERGGTFYNDLNDLFNNSDAVIVAVPSKYHVENIARCVQYKKHILSEKPLADDPALAFRVVEMQEDNPGLVISVNHTEIGNPVIQELFKQTRGKKIKRINSIRGGPNIPNNQTIRNDGVLYDLLPHEASVHVHLAGRMPRSVSADVYYENFSGGEVLEASADVRLYFDDNLRSNITIDWNGGARERKISLCTDDKRAYEAKYFEQILSVTEPFNCESKKYEDIIVASKDAIHDIPIEPSQPFVHIHNNWISDIMNGTSLSSSVKEGADIVKIVDAAQRSHGNKIYV